jgi:hypothetical protein
MLGAASVTKNPNSATADFFAVDAIDTLAGPPRRMLAENVEVVAEVEFVQCRVLIIWTPIYEGVERYT